MGFINKCQDSYLITGDSTIKEQICATLRMRRIPNQLKKGRKTENGLC